MNHRQKCKSWNNTTLRRKHRSKFSWPQLSNGLLEMTPKAQACHTKWSKSEKEKYHMTSLKCGIKKKWYKWTYKAERDSQTLWMNTYMADGEKDGERQ